MAFIQSGSLLPRTSLSHGTTPLCSRTSSTIVLTPQTFTIEAAKRPQFKATKKHERFRPRKHRPSDINRKPPPFNPEPLKAEGIPPCYEIIPATEQTATATMDTPPVPDVVPKDVAGPVKDETA